MSQEKLVYRETYRKPYRQIRGETKVGCLAKGFEVSEAFLMAVGRVRRGKEEVEYLDIRVYTRECP